VFCPLRIRKRKAYRGVTLPYERGAGAVLATEACHENKTMNRAAKIIIIIIMDYKHPSASNKHGRKVEYGYSTRCVCGGVELRTAWKTVTMNRAQHRVASTNQRAPNTDHDERTSHGVCGAGSAD